MTAEERGMDMMVIPIKDLPLKARMFAKKLCDEVGMYMETLLTAWTVYAHLEEGLENTDDLYTPRPKDIEWFENYVEEVSTGETIVSKIIEDLTDRRGLRQEWDNIDDDIQQEIKETWMQIVRENLK